MPFATAFDAKTVKKLDIALRKISKQRSLVAFTMTEIPLIRVYGVFTGGLNQKV